MPVAKLKTSLVQKIGNMEDSDFEVYDRRGRYEGFGAFMWLCIIVLFGLVVTVGAALIHVFC